jgi:hypothetical protein
MVCLYISFSGHSCRVCYRFSGDIQDISGTDVAFLVGVINIEDSAATDLKFVIPCCYISGL